MHSTVHRYANQFVSRLPAHHRLQVAAREHAEKARVIAERTVPRARDIRVVKVPERDITAMESKDRKEPAAKDIRMVMLETGITPALASKDRKDILRALVSKDQKDILQAMVSKDRKKELEARMVRKEFEEIVSMVHNLLVGRQKRSLRQLFQVSLGCKKTIIVLT